MVQFLSIIFFLGFLQFLLDFSKFPVFLCHPPYIYIYIYIMCSGFNYCDRNVNFTQMNRTQVTGDFLVSFEHSVLKLWGSVTQ